MAEQKGEEEKKKVIELQKQIAEERQIQELRQLQVASGHVVKIVDNTLDWMYEGPAAEKIQEQSTEEYLLGKTYKPKDDKSSDLQKVGESQTLCHQFVAPLQISFVYVILLNRQQCWSYLAQ
jgi:predicted ATPase